MIQITGTFLGHEFDMLVDEDYTPPPSTPAPTTVPEPWGRDAMTTPPEYPTATDITDATPDNAAPDDYAATPNQGTPPPDGSAA